MRFRSALAGQFACVLTLLMLARVTHHFEGEELNVARRAAHVYGAGALGPFGGRRRGP